ncbi:hypothetical protein [Mesorhizobium sp. B4-1-4]|nr:hypothetical protein [Mesorhizobium sp. B4-1-4]UCI34901.1 hypothetical protein FJW03_29500 [Mesorhizobium sp. B4-1-4]
MVTGDADFVLIVAVGRR